MKKQKTKNINTLHSPVLLQEVLGTLMPRENDSYLDLTVGYAGHATKIIESTRCPDLAVLCDRDLMAVDYVKSLYHGKRRPEVVHSDFLSATTGLLQSGRTFDIILADLGVSSPHLDIANRGFSLAKDGPLDMRMDQSISFTADDIVNSFDEDEIASILRVYGEESRARSIARTIVANRPINSTTQLAECIKKAYGGLNSKRHPATRSFQAIRIAVNDEISMLTDMLPNAIRLLAPGGRLGVITFHSLEDRIVKQLFTEQASMGYESELKILTKKPILPSNSEIRFNPRARSAKLRAVEKIKRKG